MSIRNDGGDIGDEGVVRLQNAFERAEELANGDALWRGRRRSDPRDRAAAALDDELLSGVFDPVEDVRKVPPRVAAVIRFGGIT